eukprot:TRINITY_DN1474_c0_g1_i1.p1 TRINITY_DN1474_c0_g1~~TRINITY_DN1474_c0_g1_i1.p1  ORF type:complete len:338 (+),score=71.23 TRINITY_DN1474_c0_g1_i1:75-1088(+)
MASVAVMRPGDLPQIGYPSASNCNKATIQRSSGRSQSQRAVSKPARKVAPAGWTMCECEADNDWILCDHAEAMAAELGEIFKQNMTQGSQEQLQLHVAKDEVDLPELHSAAKEVTMARFQLEEEEREALRMHGQVENGDGYGSDQRSALAGEEDDNAEGCAASNRLRLASGAAGRQKASERRNHQSVSSPSDDSEPAEKELCEGSLWKEEEGRVRARPLATKPRSSSRRRKHEAKGTSDPAETDDVAVTSHVSDSSENASRKLSKAERKAANARELELHDPQSQPTQDEGKAPERDSRKVAKPEKRISNDSKESDDSSASCKHRGKSRKSRRATQDD